ncbi:MAG: hypothetical protein P8188_11015 [Gemmatimonadota bacterium]
MTPLAFLALASGTLLVGPVAFFFLRRRRGPFCFLDGFVMVAVPGLVFFHVVPEAVAHRDLALGFALAAGLAAPGTLERLTRDVAGRTDQLALVLGISGLAVHALLEGAALTPLSGLGDLGLGLAVALHRIPVGLAVWWLVRERAGDRAALAAVLGVVAISAVGFAGGGPLVGLVSGGAVELYQAFVGGTLVHVAFHQIGGHHASGPGRLDTALEGMGALAAVLLLAALTGVDAGGGEGGAGALVRRFGALTARSAPALLVAWVGTAVLRLWLPDPNRLPSNRGPAALLEAVGLGLLDRRRVIPPSAGRGVAGPGVGGGPAVASVAASAGMGLDAALLSLPLLGGALAGVRVTAVAAVAVLAGWWAGRRGPALASDPPSSVPVEAGRGLRSHLRDAVDQGAPPVLAGLPPFRLSPAALTPVSAVLLAGGFSPGAVLALLLTGPLAGPVSGRSATHRRGPGTAWGPTAGVVGAAILLGLGLDRALGRLPLPGPSLDELVAGAVGTPRLTAVALLSLLVLGSLIRRGVRRFFRGMGTGTPAHHPHTHPHDVAVGSLE